MIEHGDTLESQVGTMVINEDEDSGTMQRFDTGPTGNSNTGPQGGSGGSRPSFMEYFDKKDDSGQGSKSTNVAPDQAWKITKNINELDFEFLKNLKLADLQAKLNSLDPEMEKEIENLRNRYHHKKQPILEAIEAKKRRQQNF